MPIFYIIEAISQQIIDLYLSSLNKSDIYA